MKKTHSKKTASAETIAKHADAGKNISQFFGNNGKMMPPIQRVNVDFTEPMLKELDETALKLNVSRQAVIKLFLRHALDHHYLAAKSNKTG
jgi:hypothetical protein